MKLKELIKKSGLTVEAALEFDIEILEHGVGEDNLIFHQLFDIEFFDTGHSSKVILIGKEEK